MNYSKSFNYGKIKDDFDYPDSKKYYSSTHTSFDSWQNSIPTLDDLEREYPDKLKTFRWGKGNQFYATYGIGNFGELELLDTNWDEKVSTNDKELKEENERLKKYIDYLKEKNDALKKDYKEKNSENKRKANAFDKLWKLFCSKFICTPNYIDVYGGGKNGPVKVGQWLEGQVIKPVKFTDKETIKLLNLLLMGMGSEYYVQYFGYTGLDDKNTE